MFARGLNDCFTEGGFWWREGNKENEVAGTLAFDPEACHVLRLFGMLHDVVRLRSPPINQSCPDGTGACHEEQACQRAICHK